MRHARLVHRLPHRLRLIAPALEKQPERCCILEILLRKHGAVRHVRAVAQIGSVTIHFDPLALSEERLLAVLDAVIGNIVSAPVAVPPAPTLAPDPAPDHAAPSQECNAAI